MLGGTSVAKQVEVAYRKVRDRHPLKMEVHAIEEGVPVYRLPAGTTGVELPRRWVPEWKKRKAPVFPP